ncbi:MAG: heme NO-binding domain-containing protein [Acidimicrobiales bacterium]
MVNKAIEDLATSAGGAELWEAIKERAGIDVVEFVSMDSYDDELTFRLVAAASDVLARPAAEILEMFGKHWILYTGREGYGPLLSSGGSTVPEFVRNLDALHARVRLMMPELRPPSFAVEELSGGRQIVHYYSTRAGFGPMVVGLLKGLGDLLGQQIEVERSACSEDGADHDEFIITCAPVAVATAALAGEAQD